MEKPFIKWVGGKTNIIDKIIATFPTEINNYHEPFLGGGSVLLALLTSDIKITGKIYASDINANLITVYQKIKNNPNELYDYLENYFHIYNGITQKKGNRKPVNLAAALLSQESYYYWIRKKYNEMDKSSVEAAALFIFLNKAGFRGLYREGPNGFNVPFGNYNKLGTNISREKINNISKILQPVEFKVQDFTTSLEIIEKGDFIYCDPPYVPIKADSFVNYTDKGFDKDKHNQLFDKLLLASKKEIKFVMSNAKVDLVLEKFKDHYIIEILARRAINCKNPEQKIKEIIVHN